MASASESVPESSPSAPPRILRRRGRLAAWIGVVAIVVLAMPAWAFLLRDGGLILQLDLFRAGLLGGAALMLLMWMMLASTPINALRLSPYTSKRVILLISALLTAAALAWPAPILDDEPLRYRADGTSWLNGVSPYSLTPDEVTALWQSLGSAQSPLESPDDPFNGETRTITEAVPGQDRATRIGPVLQGVAVMARAVEYLLAPGSRVVSNIAATRPATDWREAMETLPWWRQLWSWRLMLGAVYLLTVGELIAWLRQRDQSVWWAATFAWVPLTWFSSIAAGHGEIVGVLFFVAALRRLELNRNRRAALCLAGAAAVQPLTLLLLPFALRQAESRPDRSEPATLARRRFAVWLIVTSVLLWLPVLLIDGGWRGFGHSVFMYINGVDDTWRNAPLPRMIVWLILDDSNPTRRLWVRLLTIGIGGVGLLIVASFVWTRRAGIDVAAYALLLTAFLLAGDAPPWRMIWPLALVPILAGRGGLTALVWAGTCGLHYTRFTLSNDTNPANVLVAEYIPVYVAAVVEIIIVSRRTRPRVAERHAGAIALQP